MDSSAYPQIGPEQDLRRSRELSILKTIAEALNRSVDLEGALQAALAQVADLFGLHTGWVWLLRESTGETYLAAAQNLPPGLANYPARMEGSCYCLDTYQAGYLEGAANVSVITCSRLKKLVDGTDGLRYHASVPLFAHGKPLGVLNVASPDWRELSPEDLRLLYTIGDMLGIAIERARLFSQSAELGAVKERNRLAREIHDTLAQGLTGITLRLETADALLESGQNDRARAALQQALALTQSSLDEARRSVLDLRAAPLEGRSLGEALCALAQQAGGHLDVRCTVAGGSSPLPARVEAGLYRIAQEALNNIRLHAHARTASLDLLITPDSAELTVQDDGRGFDPSRVGGERFGLVGLNERARLMGGSLEIQTGPGEGARLTVKVPLSP